MVVGKVRLQLDLVYGSGTTHFIRHNQEVHTIGALFRWNKLQAFRTEVASFCNQALGSINAVNFTGINPIISSIDDANQCWVPPETIEQTDS